MAKQTYSQDSNASSKQFRQCWLPFGAKAFVLQFAIENMEIKRHRILILLFCMGVKLGLSH
jgi:hypothetical protein